METVNYFASKDELTLIHGYNKQHNVPTWVIHTPLISTIGGFSAEFIGFVDDFYANIKKANGDVISIPFTELTVRVKF